MPLILGSNLSDTTILSSEISEILCSRLMVGFHEGFLISVNLVCYRRYIYGNLHNI